MRSVVRVRRGDWCDMFWNIAGNVGDGYVVNLTFNISA